jgi:hypothetical protein
MSSMLRLRAQIEQRAPEVQIETEKSAPEVVNIMDAPQEEYAGKGTDESERCRSEANG